jgi:hypothetical protein
MSAFCVHGLGLHNSTGRQVVLEFADKKMCFFNGNISGANQGIRINPCKPTNKSRKKFSKKLCIYFIAYSTTI